MAKFYAPIKLSESIRETPEGFLLCLNVQIARTGWQEYGQGETPLESGDDGLVHVYRSPDEVFREQTVASFEGKAVTIRHPEQFVGPENWSQLAKGVVQNVRRAKEVDDDGEECLLADLLITDDFAIKLVKSGLREVSCGYEAEYTQTEAGKGLQTNIVGNHLALVEEGRAGPAYAINDEKRAADMEKKLIDRLKAKFGAKVVDEAMAEASKEDKKDSKDGEMKGYDELMKAVKDLAEKVDGMLKAKDEEKPAEKKEEPKAKDEEEKKDEPKAKDEEEPAKKDEEKAKDEDPSLEERLKALELAVAKLLEAEQAEAGDEEEKKDESKDEESEESEDEEKESSVVGDAARAEILAPGLKCKPAELKVEALKAAYKTADGKEVIDTLSGGKAPTFDAKTADALFIAASEVLKARRGSGLGETKDGKKFKGVDSGVDVMTAEKMNEINAAHWAKK